MSDVKPRSFQVRFRRPTHTTIVAYLALFLAIGGGTAFAVVGANQVNSESIIDGQVKNQDLGNDSVGTAKVKPDALTGQDIQESSLGAVPDAGAVDGVSAATLRYVRNGDSAVERTFRAAGLEIWAQCVQGKVFAYAKTNRNDSTIHLALNYKDSENPDVPQGAAAAYIEDDDFDTGEPFYLTAGPGGFVPIDALQATLTFSRPTARASADFPIFDGGSVLTLTYMSENGTGHGGKAKCLLTGVATYRTFPRVFAKSG
jgi:hypothetical protein